MSKALQSIETEYTDKWKSAITNQSILRTYVTFKQSFHFENYLNLNSAKIRSAITQLRVSSHHLQIEKGRYHKPKKIPAEERKCLHCTLNVVEDEIHFLMHCPNYSEERTNLLNNLKQYTPISVLTSTELLSSFFSLNLPQLRQIGKFILRALNIRGQ